jgi:hypothetical protein
MVDGKFDLLFGERISKMVQIHELIVDVSPIKIMGAGGTPLHGLLKMVMHNILLGNMIGNPPKIVLQAMNVVFSPTSIHTQMEEFCVCITLLKIGNSSTLFFP